MLCFETQRIPTSEKELWDAIEKDWDDIPIRTVDMLIIGMPGHVEKLRKRRKWAILH